MTNSDARLKEIAEHTSRASHDVRTPLTSISGFAELLAEDANLSDSSRDCAETILNETRSLTERLDRYFLEIGRLTDVSYPQDE
ncbi:MAG: histidine kinase dimerization/phospho-acceptor domain-containing protein [Pyrinomonadaceae bacterium]